MSELRWILLAAGVVIVGAIYLLWGRDLSWRWRPGVRSYTDPARRREPSLSDDTPSDSFEALIGSGDAPQAKREKRPPQAAPAPRVPDNPPLSVPSQPAPQRDDAVPQQNKGSVQTPQKIVVLHVASRGSVHFSGAEIAAALQAENLQLGKFDIFHRAFGDLTDSLFSVASMVEPGTFDPARLEEMETPGVSLFLVLPCPIDAAEAFSEMLIAARNLAQRLGAEVLDDQGSSLSNQTAGHIREEVLAFQLRLRALDDARH